MFSNWKSEPEEEGSKFDESAVSGGKFFVTSGDTAVAFESAEIVFDEVTGAVVAAVKTRKRPATAPRRNAGAGLPAAHVGAKRRRVEGLVCDEVMAPHRREHRLHRAGVGSLARCQGQRERSAAGIDDRRDLGVASALGPADGLRRLATSGIEAVLMDLAMRAIE